VPIVLDIVGNRDLHAPGVARKNESGETLCAHISPKNPSLAFILLRQR